MVILIGGRRPRSRREQVREQVLYDPYYYQEQARIINEILKTEFMDKGKPIKPRDTTNDAAVAVGFCTFFVYMLLSTKYVGKNTTDPRMWWVIFLCLLTAVASSFLFERCARWWQRLGKLTASDLIEAKKDQ